MKANILTGVVLITLLVTGLFTKATAQETEPDKCTTVGKVVARYIEALGGRDAIEKLTTRTVKGRLVTDLPSRKPPVFKVVDFELSSKTPNKCLSVFHEGDDVIKSGSDGTVGWALNEDGLREETEPIRSKLVWLLHPQNALVLEEYFPDLSVTGHDNINGHDVCVIESAKLDKAHYTLYFDVDSGLLRRIGYYWDLDEYREVDGVLFPHKIATSRKGGSSTYIFEEVIQNQPLPDSLFAMPEAVGE